MGLIIGLIALSVWMKKKTVRVKTMNKPRLLYFTVTIYFFWIMRFALLKTNPRIVLLYQPITILYYALGVVCLLVQIIDYVRNRNESNLDP